MLDVEFEGMILEVSWWRKIMAVGLSELNKSFGQFLLWRLLLTKDITLKNWH